jgi:uncharacterized protein YjbI with pentapeptide repeats
MNESSPVVLDAETPVNPYSLLEAVNRSSKSANTAWLIYIALMGYLLITVAGVSHKDLLLNNDVSLPILQVKIPLTRFFLFVPVLLVLMHMAVIAQLVLLARKTLEFSAAVRMLEVSDRRSHPLRLELDNLIFVQAIAGPERSRVIGFLLHAMSWLTLVLMPVLLLLYIQSAFLPYHDVAITAVNRAALVADMALLGLIGVFLWRLETSLLRAFWRTGRHHPISLALTALLLLGVADFSLFVATIPDATSERAGSSLQERSGSRGAGGALWRIGGDGLTRLLPRNLIVSDMNLVVDRDTTSGARSINLRGRDLRNAKLDRSDLRQADLTGANLDGASLAGADLRGAWIACGDLDRMMLTENRLLAQCASARDADFSKARLAEAKMAGVDLSGARLNDADLEGAQLAQAVAGGASFAAARLDGADISGASLLGANFLLASLLGADLGGAKLQWADFTSAAMQGANLSLAGLQGGRLREAQLEGASLQLTKLHGADLAGAKLQGSDLTGALVWRALPPGSEDTATADMAQIVLRLPTEEELGAIAALLAEIDSAALKSRLTEGVAVLADAAQNAAWANSAEQQLWQGWIKSSEAAADGYKGRLTEYLERLMCRSRSANGALATGVARRVLGPAFKGDLVAIYTKLKAADCPAAQGINPRVLRELALSSEALGAQ